MARSLWRVFVPVLVVVTIVFVTLSVLKSQIKKHPNLSGDPNAPSITEVRVGAVLEDLTFERLGASSIHFSELKGKVVLINFWATWCDACVVEMPSILALWKEYHGQGFEVVSVNEDENPEAVVPKAIAAMKLEFPVAIDRNAKLSDRFDVHAIPLTVILDSNRKVLAVEDGERDWNSKRVQTLIEGWLAQ
ncbi:TlpA disulfide reductase family protein [Bdellovibrionota bacterium FG-2]